MRFITKRIKNKNYFYAEHSFRLPNGKIKVLSKRVNSKTELPKDYFQKKEVESYQKYAQSFYVTDSIYTEKKIADLEECRVGFKYLKNKLTKKQFEDILHRFTVNCTYETNAIEGNSLTLKDVTLFLGEKIVPKNRNLREIYETRNTHQAHTSLFERKFAICKKDILKIHSIIVKDMDIHMGFKQLPNYLLMRSVKTTPPEKVESEIDSLVEWYNKKVHEKWHPLKIATHFHAKFEKIHPFEDGNGRVGRILLNVILFQFGYPPLIIRKTMKEKYFTCLAAADNNSFSQLEYLLISKFKKTYSHFFEEYVKYV
ncbi:MAG: Fic family protein [Candidatus Woesearchaeota archaeon]